MDFLRRLFFDGVLEKYALSYFQDLDSGVIPNGSNPA